MYVIQSSIKYLLPINLNTKYEKNAISHTRLGVIVFVKRSLCL